MARAVGLIGLPHGAVSVANVKDAATREALRKLSENQQALAKALAEQQRKERER